MGPFGTLCPADPTGPAVMTQWVNLYINYLYTTIVRDLIVPPPVFPQRGVLVDERRGGGVGTRACVGASSSGAVQNHVSTNAGGLSAVRGALNAQ